MAGIDFPDYVKVDLSTLSTGLASNTIRTEFESGEAEQRKLNTRDVFRDEMTLIIPESRVADFRLWLASTGGQYFNFHAHVNDAKVEVRMVGGADGLSLERGGRDQRMNGERVYVAEDFIVEGYLT